MIPENICEPLIIPANAGIYSLDRWIPHQVRNEETF